MERTISTLPIQNLFIVKGNKLVELAINSINIKKGGIIEYLDKNGNVLLTESENNIVKAYADKMNFEKSICLDRITPLEKGKLVNVNVEAFYKTKNNRTMICPTWDCNEVGIVGYTWDGTQAQEAFLPLQDINVEARYDKNTYNASFIKVDTLVPMWETSGLCFEHHEYDVQHEDGTIEHVIGGFKRLALTPAQSELVEQFKSILKQMQDAHIELVCDSCCDNVYAFNNEGNGYEILYNDEIDDECRSYTTDAATRIGFIAAWNMDDCSIVERNNQND